ncbi:MAG: transcription-repair coupling factor [Firmicutes bacterium]|nr:transcription-repair coupling factor [Bacillota bacterium]
MSLFDNLIDISYISGKIAIDGINNGIEPLYLYNLYKKTNRGLFVVTSSLYEANKLYNSLYCYTDDVLLFPMDDFLTTRIATISPELKSVRLSTINELLNNGKKIVITHLMGFLKFLPNKESSKQNILQIQKGKNYKRENLLNSLDELGYNRDTIVTNTGEYAVRGYILDLFPINEQNPIRVEFFDDEIESIRSFNPETQLSIKELNNIEIRPFNEVNINKEHSSLLDYVENPILIYFDYNKIKNSYTSLVSEIFEYNERNNSNEEYMHDFDKLSINDEIFVFKTDNVLDGIKLDDKVQLYSSSIPMFNGNIENIKNYIYEVIDKNKTVILCFNTEKQLKNFNEYILENSIITSENNIIENKINLILKQVINGFSYNNYVVLGTDNLFGNITNRSNIKSNYKYGTKIKDINKLNIGDYVVHNIHGIGVYCGIVTLSKGDIKKDYLKLKYKGNDVLYIPVEKIDLISKYSSNEGAIPKVNKLGGTEWEKTKLRVKSKVKNIAQDLLKLYAEREAKKGFAFLPDSEEQILFENEFSYTPTSDQLLAIKQIKEDMQKEIPMDRLLCGDVGFGKTEVAFRAAFKAILSGKQVAYLCPTTILSSQHYKNALERFKSFPINISLLNRFVTPKKVKDTLEGLKNGTVDFVIGTHRLLSNDIEFKDLGLLIIDEEQRFGVTHKEKIKEIKNNVDVLTLSATPIPRTLQMSMVGIRNLSLIETAPVDRYPVQTYVLPENKSIIKDVIYKELSRDGQVFLLFNSVEQIVNKYYEISKMIPDAKVTYAHGQMSRQELEDRMQSFINHEYDILICTTIIETGIDIPNANTLIILDADHFGLSQLYQIRGRVGRANKIGYAYLMYDEKKVLNDIASKRLQVIKDFTELGSGFSIAMRDLSIRGAGDILGSEQSGFIDTIGIELYIKMLNEEVAKIKGIEVKEDETDEKPIIEVDTHISDEYVSEEALKIEIHKKINEIDSYNKLISVKQELEDRFGKITETMLIYMYEEWLDKLSKQLGIQKFNQTKTFVECVFSEDTSEKIDGEKLFYEANSISRMFRFSYSNKKIKVILDTIKLDKHWIYYMVDLLSVFETYKKS